MKLLWLFLVCILILSTVVHATFIVGGTPEKQKEVQSFLSTNHLEYTIAKISLADYENAYYFGYAWYKARSIILYKNAWNTSFFLTTLAHEAGHVIAEKNRQNKYNYPYNEAQADTTMEGLLR